MTHTCELKLHDSSIIKDTFRNRIKKKVQTLVVISEDNPLSFRYFRSALTVRREKERQLQLKRWYVIHPFSKFRAAYDIYLFIFFLLLMIYTPFDCSFVKVNDVVESPYYLVITSTLNLLCWVDIIINFFTGYTIDQLRTIELRGSKVSLHYLKSPYFLIDVISSFPRNLWVYINQIDEDDFTVIIGVINILTMLKMFRLIFVTHLVQKLAWYFRLRSRGGIFMTNCALVCLLTVHWMACLQYGISRLIRVLFSFPNDERSWIFQKNLIHTNVGTQYTHCLLKSTAYILGIRLGFYDISLPEEYIVVISTYIMGKILIASVWVILAIAIMNSRSVDIKYQEIINQVNEYMKQKMVPLELRKRINQYYRFKYQTKYFKESFITSLMSDKLKKEVDLLVCKLLIKNVALFSQLSPEEILEVVTYLTPEIFMPNNRIIVSGDFGDSMYFLSSGTVAVYTHSGKEVCHLQDGAYFGEISLIIKGQSRVATVIAIETSMVYRLDRKSFEKSLMKNKDVYLKISQQAEERLRETNLLEESYKKVLFEKIYHH